MLAAQELLKPTIKQSFKLTDYMYYDCDYRDNYCGDFSMMQPDFYNLVIWVRFG